MLKQGRFSRTTQIWLAFSLFLSASFGQTFAATAPNLGGEAQQREVVDSPIVAILYDLLAQYDEAETIDEKVEILLTINLVVNYAMGMALEASTYEIKDSTQQTAEGSNEGHSDLSLALKMPVFILGPTSLVFQSNRIIDNQAAIEPSVAEDEPEQLSGASTEELLKALYQQMPNMKWLTDQHLSKLQHWIKGSEDIQLRSLLTVINEIYHTELRKRIYTDHLPYKLFVLGSADLLRRSVAHQGPSREIFEQLENFLQSSQANPSIANHTELLIDLAKKRIGAVSEALIQPDQVFARDMQPTGSQQEVEKEQLLIQKERQRVQKAERKAWERRMRLRAAYENYRQREISRGRFDYLGEYAWEQRRSEGYSLLEILAGGAIFLGYSLPLAVAGSTSSVLGSVVLANYGYLDAAMLLFFSGSGASVVGGVYLGIQNCRDLLGRR